MLARSFIHLIEAAKGGAGGKKEQEREREGTKESRGERERKRKRKSGGKWVQAAVGEGSIDCVKWAAKCWLRFWSWTSNALHCLTCPPPTCRTPYPSTIWAVPDHDKAQRKRKCPQRWAVEPTALDLLSALSMGRDPSSSSRCIHALTIVFTRYSLSIHSVIKTPVASRDFPVLHVARISRAASCCPHPGLALNNAWHDAAWIRLEICHIYWPKLMLH